MATTKRAPGVDEAAEVSTVDAQGNPTDPKMGLWDAAFTFDGNLKNDEGVGKCFVDNDSRRFFIQVRDKTAPGDFVEVEWEGANITCLRKSQGVFRSAALIYVSDSVDLDVKTDCGLPAGHARAKPSRMRSKGDVDFRIRLGEVEGRCHASYGNMHLQSPLFSTVKSVQVAIFGVRERGIALPGDFWTARVPKEVRILKETFGRYGIAIRAQRGVHFRPTAGKVDERPIADYGTGFEIGFPSETGLYTDKDEHKLADAFKVDGGITAFYVQQFDGQSAGETPVPHIAATFVQTMQQVPSPPGPYTLAHEVGHLLMEKGPNRGHWNGNHEPTTNDQNLMRTIVVNGRNEGGATVGCSRAENLLSSKRLWPVPDDDGFRQLDALFQTPLVK